jgi:hypothetical protein
MMSILLFINCSKIIQMFHGIEIKWHKNLYEQAKKKRHWKRSLINIFLYISLKFEWRTGRTQRM